ncbi:MAG: hypothetical protein A3J28_02010 [Acidobacteria bacterium RIFCSPLOWO2_12_FULL_60_22]|nr:MAG: hypothetical protein A3J28_02010 [Acidobacteria bacterium RIFCSPLOWO2_12_FULL_60_22]
MAGVLLFVRLIFAWHFSWHSACAKIILDNDGLVYTCGGAPKLPPMASIGEKQKESRWASAGRFGWRFFEALLRVLAFAFFAGIHEGINAILIWATPEGLTGARDFVIAVNFCVFLLVYAYLGWDMITVFIPRLKGKRNGA